MTRWFAGVGVCALALVGTAIGFGVSGGSHASAIVAAPGRSQLAGSGPALVAPAARDAPLAPPARDGAAAQTSAPEPTSGWIATVQRATSWYRAPSGPVGGALAATNPFGAPQTLAVVGAPKLDGWYHVELPIRPNGSTGWVSAFAVRLTWTPYSVRVDLASRMLQVLDGARVVVSSPVAIGTPRTPTPPDQTYIWELVATDQPEGDYGPDIFGLAEFSDAYAVFNGGDAQIAVHGTDEPWSIGEAASSGCVRLPDSVVSRLVGLLPLGTPVTIS